MTKKIISGDKVGLGPDYFIQVSFDLSGVSANCGMYQLTSFCATPYRYAGDEGTIDPYTKQRAYTYTRLNAKQMRQLEKYFLELPDDEMRSFFFEHQRCSLILISAGIGYENYYSNRDTFLTFDLMRWISTGKMGACVANPPVLNHNHGGASSIVAMLWMPRCNSIVSLDEPLVVRGKLSNNTWADPSRQNEIMNKYYRKGFLGANEFRSNSAS